MAKRDPMDEFVVQSADTSFAINCLALLVGLFIVSLILAGILGAFCFLLDRFS